MNMEKTRGRYQVGWDDGYAEGYGCKLSDATEPFNPQSLGAPEIVEAVADMLEQKYRKFFPTRPEAIGCARAMLKTAMAPELPGNSQ